ncbi:hypothetical protein A2U01_0083537, partial [Trifolium medium]|nr:hypothetical protein [Trifolium medium]
MFSRPAKLALTFLAISHVYTPFSPGRSGTRHMSMVPCWCRIKRMFPGSRNRSQPLVVFVLPCPIKTSFLLSWLFPTSIS